MTDLAALLPKAELHIHIEGALEPDLMFALGRRNGISLPYRSAEQVRAAYVFSNLQSFLDIYYRACDVLRGERDFYDLTMSYLRRAGEQGVRHTEVFFDPQTHTVRGVQIGKVIEGIAGALADGKTHLGITSGLIMCFLRHLSADDAMATLDAARPYRRHIEAVGLDSSEVGNPPVKFKEVFERARAEGFRTVAHAGEEGPPEYIWQALVDLKAERIDHGVRALEDPRLVDRLVEDQTPLTTCPLSNVKLGVFDKIENHPLGRMLEAGLCPTINSDDPAYFGGYVADNYVAVARGLKLPDAALVQLARNSFKASFLPEKDKARHLGQIEALIHASPGLRGAGGD